MKRPKYAVRFLRVAEDDFNEIITYIAAENRAAAEMMATKMKRTLHTSLFIPASEKSKKTKNSAV